MKRKVLLMYSAYTKCNYRYRLPRLYLVLNLNVLIMIFQRFEYKRSDNSLKLGDRATVGDRM